jgi:hypothetical protein
MATTSSDESLRSQPTKLSRALLSPIGSMDRDSIPQLDVTLPEVDVTSSPVQEAMTITMT